VLRPGNRADVATHIDAGVECTIAENIPAPVVANRGYGVIFVRRAIANDDEPQIMKCNASSIVGQYANGAAYRAFELGVSASSRALAAPQ
jgi:hypothetical protein